MRVATIEELARDPVGRYVAGDTFVHFCADSALWGVLLWGRPDEDQAVQLGRSLVLELGPAAAPHASFVDARWLRGGDVGAFAALGRYLTKHRVALGKQVTRLALVRPPGLEGAIVAGAYEVLPRPYPVQIFDDAEQALKWLAPKSDAAKLAKTLADVYATASKTPALLGTLRSWLEMHLADPEIDALASAIGVSERTLQRKLGELGTSFRDEVASARVRVAQKLLVDGDAPLTTIALEVGCGSLQHFSALFRRIAGETPSAWRTRNRKRA
ncbi:MAG: helix-turn-helix transcriptional regulator [Polyangiaceae bacterium]